MNRLFLTLTLFYASLGCALAQVDTIYVVDTIDFIEPVQDPDYEIWLAKRRAWQAITTSLEVTTQIPKTNSLWLYANLWEHNPGYAWANASLEDAQLRLRKYLRELQWQLGAETDESATVRKERLESPWSVYASYQQGFYRILHDHETIDQPWWNEYGMTVGVSRSFLQDHLVIQSGLGLLYRANRDEYKFDGVVYQDGITSIRGPNLPEAVFLAQSDEFDHFKRFHYTLQVPLALGFKVGIIQVRLGAEGQLRTRKNEIHRLWDQEWLGTAAISATLNEHYQVGLHGFRGVTPFWDQTFTRIRDGAQYTLTSYRSGIRLDLGYVF